AQGQDRIGPEDADLPRARDHQAALRPQGRLYLHAGRGGPHLQGDPRTRPPDRSQGGAQATAPGPQSPARRLPRRGQATPLRPTPPVKRPAVFFGRRTSEKYKAKSTKTTAPALSFRLERWICNFDWGNHAGRGSDTARDPPTATSGQGSDRAY